MRIEKRISAGFSLVELLVTMGVLLVMVAIAAPSVTRSVRTYRVGSAAADVSNIVQRTRYEAIRRNIRTICRGQMANGQWQIWIDLNNDKAVNANEPFILMPADMTFLDQSQVPAPDSMGYPQTRLIQGQIAFDPRGTVDFLGAAPAVMLSYIGIPTDPSSGYRAVAVTPNGKTRIWKSTGGQSGYWR